MEDAQLRTYHLREITFIAKQSTMSTSLNVVYTFQTDTLLY